MYTMNLKVFGRGLTSPQNRSIVVAALPCLRQRAFPTRRHSTFRLQSSHFASQRLRCIRSEVIPTVHPLSFSSAAATRAPEKMSPAPKGTENEPMTVDGQGQVEEPSKLYFVKMTPNASTPTKGSKLAAGYDLKSAYDEVVPKRGSALVKTDIQIRLPSGTYGRIAPRSGLAWKNKLDVGAGVIDEDYRGNIGVILFNHSDEDFVVSKGDRIAQLICEKICYPEIEELETLDETERGEGGFGSTGVKKAKIEAESEQVEVTPEVKSN